MKFCRINHIIALESAEDYAKYVESLPEDEVSSKQWTYLVMQHIHGRSLQIYLEVITLMKNGFADGAYARWRSMYELAVIGSFIIKYGERVAKKYYEASGTEDRYDWAKESGAFPEAWKHITFSNIKDKCGLDTTIWENQYKLANRTVHATPQGTFGRLGNMGTFPVIPVGRSDYGITVAGEHSAISLAHITYMFLSIYGGSDNMLSIQVTTRWIEVVREAYFKTHDEVFPEDEPLWKERE